MPISCLNEPSEARFGAPDRFEGRPDSFCTLIEWTAASNVILCRPVPVRRCLLSCPNERKPTSRRRRRLSDGWSINRIGSAPRAAPIASSLPLISCEALYVTVMSTAAGNALLCGIIKCDNGIVCRRQWRSRKRSSTVGCTRVMTLSCSAALAKLPESIRNDPKVHRRWSFRCFRKSTQQKGPAQKWCSSMKIRSRQT